MTLRACVDMVSVRIPWGHSGAFALQDLFWLKMVGNVEVGKIRVYSKSGQILCIFVSVYAFRSKCALFKQAHNDLLTRVDCW